MPVLNRVTLPREPVTPRTARHYLAPRLARLGMPPEAADELLVAVGEAVTNAVLHGGAGLTAAGPEERDGRVAEPPGVAISPDIVVLELIARGDRIAVAVTSSRTGWTVPDPVLPADPLAMSGRGLYVMRHFTDAVRVEQGRLGTTVYLVRRVRRGQDGTPRPGPTPTSRGHRRAG